jgi:glutamate/tyrosine decarboxylase-like PLP-dependent enzyme
MRGGPGGILRLLAVLAATGCGGSSAYEELVDRRIATIDELMTVLEGIDNKDDIAAARPEIERIMERAAEIGAASAKLGVPTAEDRERTQGKIADAQDEIDRRMRQVQERLKGDQETIVAVSRFMMEAVIRMRMEK